MSILTCSNQRAILIGQWFLFLRLNTYLICSFAQSVSKVRGRVTGPLGVSTSDKANAVLGRHLEGRLENELRLALGAEGGFIQRWLDPGRIPGSRGEQTWLWATKRVSCMSGEPSVANRDCRNSTYSSS
jgi:hypothetical protein